MFLYSIGGTVRLQSYIFIILTRRSDCKTVSVNFFPFPGDEYDYPSRNSRRPLSQVTAVISSGVTCFHSASFAMT